ncbi:hypothetical protein M0R45_009143 [Rubus argutus]|uniref:RNase H type-1 domain-containing protein n=1 Tax=Rubus argutus TaxID=59490 RepID=A0AAW1Y346_RUBAR
MGNREGILFLHGVYGKGTLYLLIFSSLVQKVSRFFFPKELVRVVCQACQEIQRVLCTYGLASGQQVNFLKSSVVFSKNVADQEQVALAAILSVPIVPVHETYLGLPTYVGRAKTDTFHYIKDRLFTKLKGWQGKLLSGAGKEILIRVVAQALPSHAMSCFLLTNNFCKDLQQMCARFWWGSSTKKRKIHWKSWEGLCVLKERGGLGFRDLHAFNLSLLAKQEIATWTEPWIPKPPPYLPISSSLEGSTESVVADFILPSRVWDKQKVLETFEPTDANLILALPLSDRATRDHRVWSPDPKGLFTVKSAYKFYRRASRSISCHPRQVSWKTPSIGWLKINMDGAFSSDLHSGGIGIVVRDDTGQWVCGKCMTVSDVTSPEQVEALAGRFVVRMAQECGFSPVVFETDSMILTTAIRQQSYTSLIGPVYEDIVDGLSTMPGSSFHHVFRQANEAAHHLAHHALLSTSCTSWELTPPTFLTDVLMKDLYSSSSVSN